jgi:hypothetical protein
VFGGNLATHLVALGVNLHALSAHLVGSKVMGDAVGHVVFALAFAAALVFARNVAPRSAYAHSSGNSRRLP